MPAAQDRYEGYRKLVFDYLRDGAHRALLKAVAASDACLFVNGIGNAVHNFQNLLRTGIYTNAATDALISVNYWM